jgi:protoheme ferro-lyase
MMEVLLLAHGAPQRVEDVEGYAAERGIALKRPESLNGSSAFTRALGEVATRCLG